MPWFPRTVVVLGLVSFLNDAASEMITPLLPLFLTMTLGSGPVAVGFIEGVAEATSSLLKFFSGRLADRGWRHKSLVLGGYGLSNTVRPLIGLALGWAWVFLARFLDRVGKGLRSSARDAIIATSIAPHLRGRAFGFHRAMDNTGAMFGPLMAFWLLAADVPLEQVFLWSAIPGVLVVLLLALGLPNDAPRAVPLPATRFRWRDLDSRLQGLIVSAGGLSLAAVPEAFLILWATERGLQLTWVPLIWAAASAVKAIVAGVAGALSDYYGRFPILLTGWSLRIVVVIILPFIHTSESLLWGGFLAYAGCLAFTEAAERALIGDVAAQAQRGTTYGFYHMVVGLAALPGALIFGVLWQLGGEMTAFFTAATLSLMSLLGLWWFTVRLQQ